MDMKLEVVPIPVRDVDTAKEFYTRQVGFTLEHDIQPTDNMRVVQMGVQLVVEDLDGLRGELAGRGVAISDVTQMGPEGTPGSRYCFFEDPDHNMWAVQEYKRG